MDTEVLPDPLLVLLPKKPPDIVPCWEEKQSHKVTVQKAAVPETSLKCCTHLLGLVYL